MPKIKWRHYAENKVAPLCRKRNGYLTPKNDTATFYKWRAKYGGLDVSMMSRMKELEAENTRLKRMYAEERLKADILKEILGKK